MSPVAFMHGGLSIKPQKAQINARSTSCRIRRDAYQNRLKCTMNKKAPNSCRTEIHAEHPRIQAGQKRSPRHDSEIHPSPANSHGREDTIANPSTPKCTENMRTESTATGPPPCCLSKTWRPLKAPFGCQYNNWLYRSGLDPLSVTNLC